MSKSRQEIHVAPVEQLREQGVIVVRGAHHTIGVFADGEQVYAVDNRCPHMGFPLDRGTVSNGILTCHWHQARFDLGSGCTFDLWADDVLKFRTRIDNGEVYVETTPMNERTEAWYRHRLVQGIEQAVDLVQAKSLLAITSNEDGDPKVLLRDIVEFAAANLDRMSEGLIRLGCVANLYPRLNRDTAYQGLLYATRQIANEATMAVPHRSRDPLAGPRYDEARLKSWLRQWVQTRHRDGVERTLLTGLGLPEQELADLVFSVACERLYANGGHLFEDCNKVFELTMHLGEGSARKLFPLLVDGLAGARGQEESTNWHHPVEIVRPLAQLDEELPGIMANNDGRGSPAPDLIPVILGDDPIAIIATLKNALEQRVNPLPLAREVAYAAALRLARFATSNEVTDWFNPQHTFIHANAVYQAVKRSPTPEVIRAIFQGAMSVYQDRFLNVPPARLPSEKNISTDLPADRTTLLSLLLDQLNQRGDIDHAANVVARYIGLGHDFDALVDTIALGTLREDLDFHSLQVLDAAANQCDAWNDNRVIENIMVGVIRNLAAHCPTRRAGEQTARIAAKLQRGERIFEEANGQPAA